MKLYALQGFLLMLLLYFLAGISAMDVLVASEVNQCTNVSADCLSHNFIVLQQSSS